MADKKKDEPVDAKVEEEEVDKLTVYDVSNKDGVLRVALLKMFRASWPNYSVDESVYDLQVKLKPIIEKYDKLSSNIIKQPLMADDLGDDAFALKPAGIAETVKLQEGYGGEEVKVKCIDIPLSVYRRATHGISSNDRMVLEDKGIMKVVKPKKKKDKKK